MQGLLVRIPLGGIGDKGVLWGVHLVHKGFMTCFKEGEGQNDLPAAATFLRLPQLKVLSVLSCHVLG